MNYKGIRREYQGKETQHFHASLHIENTPKIDEDEDEVGTKLIDKYISCLLPNPDQYTDLNTVVKRVQTHHYTLVF